MPVNNTEPVDITEAMQQGDLIDQALQDAVRDALLDHKRTGDLIVIWKNGALVWVPADQIDEAGEIKGDGT